MQAKAPKICMHAHTEAEKETEEPPPFSRLVALARPTWDFVEHLSGVAAQNAIMTAHFGGASVFISLFVALSWT